jgi:fibronectin-binding autotransporter adhesin
MNNMLNSAKKLALLTAGLSVANLIFAQTEIWTNSSGNWSTAINWLPNAVPGTANAVVFTNNAGAPAAAGTVDNTVDLGFAGPVASLTYANTNTSGGAGFYHTTQIPATQTLTVLGNLTVGNTPDFANSQISATFTGAGTLLVSNLNAGVNVSQGDTGNGAQATLNMTNLNSFNATIGGITVGVYNTPNQSVARQKGYLYLAKTNNINILGNAPRAYGNESQIEVGENLGNGSNIQIPMYLGIVNNINVNSITVCADKQGSGALMAFNPVFTNNSVCAAYFRGTNGITSRVSSWIMGDNANQTTTGSGTGIGICDFSSGTLDAMVDTMIVGRSETGASTGAGNGTGSFTFGAGSNNVNTLYLGYRLATGGNCAGVGTMNVNGTATLVANNAICLSYWNGGTALVYASGTLNINGGSVYASTITNGVSQAGSQGFVTANINMNGGVLGLTSLQGSIGTTAWPLGAVSLNNATLQMHLNGVQTNMVASILTMGGTSNSISISSVPSSIITYPCQYPLIGYTTLNGFNFALGTLPGTYQGYISNNAANSTIDLVLTNGPTSLVSLTWNGNINGNWDVTTANWLNGGLSSDYMDGAVTLFDDTATGATNINLTDGFAPLSLTFNNSSLNYAFGGSGKINGLASLAKSGTGSVLFTNTGANNFIGGMSISAGTVQFGAGSTSGTLPSNGNVTNNGTLILNHSDTVNSFNAISGAGTLIQNGGGVVNLAGPGSFSGTTIVNTGTLLVNGTLASTLTNAAGSTIGGAGSNNGPVTVSGTIQSSAASTMPATFTSGNLSLLSGAALKFDLNGPNATVGSGSNDLLNVVGNLAVNNNTVTLNFAGIPQTSTPYTIINYSGSESGSFNPAIHGTHYTAALDLTTPNIVNVDISGSGANLKWDSATSGAWDLGITTNWINQGTSLLDVFYAGDSVLFDDTAPMTNVVIGSGVSVAPTAVTVNSTRTYTISGPGQISGAGSITKQGTGTLALNSPNANFTGTVAVQNGLLSIGSSAALGADIGTPGPVTATISSGATLDLKGQGINSANLIVSGPGVGNNGAIINSGADQIHATRYITLAGDTSLGGSGGRWDIRISGANSGTLNGDGVHPFKITKVGTNYLGLVSVAIDSSLGDVDIQSGLFSLELATLSSSPGWAGDTSHTITVENGATLSMNTLTVGAPLSRNIVLNGASTISSGGGNAIGGSVTLNGNDTINVSSVNLVDTGVISGPGNLILTGGGILALQGANTYAGATRINAGTISLNDTGSIADSTNITITAGSSIDVSPRTDTALTLASGQTLQGNGSIFGMLAIGSGATVSPGTNFASIGMLTVTNSATLSGTAWMKIRATNSTGDLLFATNGITYGGTLVVTNLSGTITNGQTFQLFSATNYTSTFSTLVLPSATGLTWTNNLAVNGTISASVVTGPPPQPHITSISLTGTNLVINGTNGLGGEQYNLLTTTNLALPLTSWTVLPTNTFSSANFSLTNGVNPGAPQSFYILRVP